MVGIRGRIEGTAGEASARAGHRLGSGEGWKSVAKGLGLDAVDLIAAVARIGLGGDGSEGPGLVQGPPEHPQLKKALTDDALAGLIPDAPRTARLALAAGLLQILDFWDAGHTAAQSADDLGERATSAYWHMIAHRREPDAGNALYWAKRVGRHPTFEALAEAARPVLEAHDDPALIDRLMPGGAWSPAALIDLATRARTGTPLATLARRLQRLEMIHLLDATVEALGLPGRRSPGLDLSASGEPAR